MNIRKAHILITHFFNTNDDSAGIFFAEEGGGLDWLWSAIEQTVSVFNNDVQEFRRLGGQFFYSHKDQRRISLRMPMGFVVGLSKGPMRIECAGVFIVFRQYVQYNHVGLNQQ